MVQGFGKYTFLIHYVLQLDLGVEEKQCMREIQAVFLHNNNDIAAK